MSSDHIELLSARMAAVTEATNDLLDTVDSLDDAALAAPCLLPGWTRGHLLTHLARNADSLVNLLLWAHTGVETPQYASRSLRDADIELGAPRPVHEQRADLVETANRLHGMAGVLTAEQWQAEVRTGQGTVIAASEVPWRRLQELRIHHADLDAGYLPRHWPPEFVAELLDEVVGDLSGRVGAESFEIRAEDTGFTATVGAAASGRTIAAPAAALLAWLLGRDPGPNLRQPLPELPAWR